MYVPKAHDESRLDVLQALIHDHPLGTWVTVGEGELVANHVPFRLDASRGPFGTLTAHIARANPLWRMASSLPSLVVFQGPQTYITPSWYPSKQEHGKAVPTWNYAVVHAHGVPTYIDDPAWLRRHLEQLTGQHEAPQAQPWRVADAPADFIERLMATIVGVEIPLQRLQGKWKTSQNRPEPDKRGVVAGLQARGDDAALQMAALVGQHIVGG